jgi:putative Holliday junction resolvase
VAESVRILAVDYGDRRVGLALSDELGIAAHGLPTEQVTSQDEAVETVHRLAKEKNAARIVVGLPLNMDGSRGPRAERTQRYCDKLCAALAAEELTIPLEMYDERMTTLRARSALHELGFREKSQRARVDRVSAIVLLQDYLSAIAERRSNGETNR